MILVVSASTHPEPQFMAAALARKGAEVKLATAASFATDEWPMRLAKRFPQQNWARQILRRQLPEGLSGKQVIRAGYLQEARQLWQRVGRGQIDAAARTREARDAVFHRKVHRVISDDHPETIIAQQNSALKPFQEASPGVFKVLGYPIAHHRWLLRELRREQNENPEWGKYLDPTDTPDETRLSELDAEIALADHVVVVSNFVRDTCIEYGVDPAKISVVPLASFPAPSGETSPPASLFPRDATFKIFFSGQLVQRKGVGYLVEAFQRLDVPGAHLTFMGGGPAELVKRLGATPHVTVIPPSNRATLMAAQREADVGVLPSLGEGFPLTAIETLAAGTPMIVSDATFGHDVISDGENGYVVPMRDVDGLVDRLRALAAAPEKVLEMKKNSPASVADFTWDSYERRFLQVFLRAEEEFRASRVDA